MSVNVIKGRCYKHQSSSASDLSHETLSVSSPSKIYKCLIYVTKSLISSEKNRVSESEHGIKFTNKKKQLNLVKIIIFFLGKSCWDEFYLVQYLINIITAMLIMTTVESNKNNIMIYVHLWWQLDGGKTSSL